MAGADVRQGNTRHTTSIDITHDKYQLNTLLCARFFSCIPWRSELDLNNQTSVSFLLLEVMDGDPAVEPELDSFSLVLPLPYRVGIIVVLGEENSPTAAHCNMR